MLGDPRVKVNIPGGHSIGHSKQKSVYVHVSYSERFPRLNYFTHSPKIVDKKEILRTVSNSGIYYSGDKLVRFTYYNTF
jgi:predicted transport protein